MKQKILFLLVSISSIGSLSAQDLIQSTIMGLKKKGHSKTNLVAKSILGKAAFAPSDLFRYAGSDLSLEDKRYLDQLIRIKLDLSSLQSLEKKKSSTLRLSIPVSKDKNFYLLLEQVDILEPGYFMETSDGRIIYPDQSKILFYRGIVEGNTNSLVSLTIIDEEVKLIISDEEGNYSLNRVSEKENIWNLYNEDRLKIKSDFKCGTHEGMLLNSRVNLPKEKYTKMMKNVPVYIEVDNDIYVAKGSNETNVQTHVMALMNATATAYTNEQINVSLGSTFIWTTASPYRKADAGFTLEDFGERVKDNYVGRLAHFITASFQSGTTGIAWTDVLCDTYNTFTADIGDGQGNILHHAGPYGLTGDINTNANPSYANNSQEILTLVHELGHNFGSPHTHGCNWGPSNNQAIDNCAALEDGPCTIVGGSTPAQENNTIMSYCQGAVLTQGFGTEPGALIRSKYNSAMCITVTGGGDCPTDATVSSATTTGNSLASNSVSTSGIVAVNGAAVFSSNNITLNEGFEVPSGNCFEANNVGCTYTGVLTCEGGGGTPSCTNYVSTDVTNKIISDAASVTSTITVGDAMTISEVELLNISGDHSYIGDIVMTLTSPDNTTITVIESGNLSCDPGTFNITIDDDAASAAGTFTCGNINPGSFKSSSVLSGFDGKASNGTWTLTITDVFEDDDGILTGWTLKICGTAIPG